MNGVTVIPASWGWKKRHICLIDSEISLKLSLKKHQSHCTIMLLMPFIPLLCAWIYTILTYGWKSDTFCIVQGEANAWADALAAKMHLKLTLTSSETFYTVCLLQKPRCARGGWNNTIGRSFSRCGYNNTGVWLFVKRGRDIRLLFPSRRSQFKMIRVLSLICE